ncbi:Mur ligase family protein [Actinotalea subterranea]|uniref:Mur ligase family protein n=1 Tax=Actinotalea subterranea TaxID=2607497 RepID=UPI0011ECE432|nr:Mur ligase family protein [Actinotalea subterranea]
MSDTLTGLLVALLCVAALAATGLRWLRVAQREHYIGGRARRIAGLWLSRSRADLALATAAAVLALVACVRPLGWGATAAGLAGAALAVVLPRGLGIRGRTSRLSWTSRLRRLAIAWALLNVALGTLLAWLLGPASLAVLVVGAPLTLDVALAVMEVVEKRLSAPFVAQAQRRLARIRPQVVAVTGSYGKTSTKGYIAHLLSASTAVVASPASFNNRLGLSRAVNDGLVEGTEVFVAEMGTYGPGEIRELCTLFPPDVAVITTIGEAHLERMRTTQTILAAKSEITERARTVVLPIDTPELAGLADRCRDAGKRVVTVSVREAAEPAPAVADADVVVDLAAGTVDVRGPEGPVTLTVGEGVAHGVNLGVALGVALAVGADLAPVGARLRALPRAAHRAEVQDPGTGLLVVDDTYNANPIGARAALDEAAALAQARGGRLVVVTPGIVELGPVQHVRNADFARAAADAGAHLVVVGRTNRAALLEGALAGGASVDVVDQRSQAVPVATSAAGEQGVILYENDLPDHYP